MISCSPKYYVPTSHNVPLISQKNEFTSTFLLHSSGFEINSTYGLTKFMAIKGSAGLYREERDNGHGGSGKFLELGIGYYGNDSALFIYEIYGIGELGTVENHFPALYHNYHQTGDIFAKFIRYGIQPNIGLKIKYFETAFSM